MAFWGAEVTRDKPYTLPFTGTKRRLRISRATLLVSVNPCLLQARNLVYIVVGNQKPILLCCLSFDTGVSCPLEVELSESDDILFTVDGYETVYLVGYFPRDAVEGESNILAREAPINNVLHIFGKSLLEEVMSFIRQSTKVTSGNVDQRNGQVVFLVDDHGTIHKGQVTSKPRGEIVTGSTNNNSFMPQCVDGLQQTDITIEELVEIPKDNAKENQIIVEECAVKESETVGDGVGKMRKKKAKQTAIVVEETMEKNIQIPEEKDVEKKRKKKAKQTTTVVKETVEEHIQISEEKDLIDDDGATKKVTKKKNHQLKREDDKIEAENVKNKDQDKDARTESRGEQMKEKSAAKSSKKTNDEKSESEALEGGDRSELKTSKKEKIEEAIEGGVSRKLKTSKKRKSDEVVEAGVTSDLTTLKKGKSVITTGVSAPKSRHAFGKELEGMLKKSKKQ